MVLKHIPTNEMVADPFTKPITRDAFVKHVRSLGLCRVWLNGTKHLLSSYNKIKSISHGSLVFPSFFCEYVENAT